MIQEVGMSLSGTIEKLTKRIYIVNINNNNRYLPNYAHVGQANTINKGTNTIQANY